MNFSHLFHPAVADWFADCFTSPTPAQASAWPAIKACQHTLIAAPTGSGKTLAAFLAAIDSLICQGLSGDLADETQVVYVSPLKALSNDIHRNLEVPLAGIREHLRRRGLPPVEIRTWVRTGDTPSAERERMRRRPPHIVVTTPESLYVLLGSESGRKMLATTRSVIIDEIHAIAPNKRGAHLALSVERLADLCGDRLLRIGLSATQNPIDAVAHLLVGAAPDRPPAAKVRIIDVGHQRPRDLSLEVPDSPLAAVMSNEVWQQVYNRLTDLIKAHRTTLVFVNTRRMAERVAHELSERLTDGAITAHHGSMAKEQRLAAEQRLKHGQLKALVATASLELGIDIGDVDLVCQLGSPRSIASFLQRVGRSGHAVGGTPKGRLFPLSRDDLVECTALLDSVRRGELDRLAIPDRPLDVLAQQIVAEVAARDWEETALYERLRRAWPFRKLPREDFAAVVRMLAEGFTTRRGRKGALIHRDGVHHVLKGRRGARTTALTSGGTIPDTADYRVLLEPENNVIGTVNEDFAVESMAGDIFQLGNRSYRIARVERGTVRVEDAHGQPPTIPFWLGEAPGRTDELSSAVSRLRAEIVERLRSDPSGNAAGRWLTGEIGIAVPAAEQLVEYLAAAAAAFGCLPTQGTIVLERFFDEAGGMQLVIHAPFGSRINRAFGLALRKRFCRKFNFELQAAATEDSIVLSLTAAHSFELADVAHYLHSASVRTLLIQAMLDAPMFTTRWRWVAGVALALPRFRGGRKVPPQFMRMQAEDLIAAIFPDQIACAENLVGEREVPDHPLTNQAISDCLHEAMDIEGLERLLARLEAGDIRVVACDLTQPSPLALEALSARPYAFLDDAPLEERRAQAVMARRWHDPQSASELGRLDPEAIERVRSEAWPDPTNAEELHDALLWLGCLTDAEVEAVPAWKGWLAALAQQRRVTHLETAEAAFWVAAERLNQFSAVWPAARREPDILPPGPAPYPTPSPTLPSPARGRGSERGAGEHRSSYPPGLAGEGSEGPTVWSQEQGLVEILRGRLEGLGPVTQTGLAAPLGLESKALASALSALEVEGSVLRGRFIQGVNDEQWCDRRLLARIHHYTVQRLRAEIEPVAARDFLRFLFAWQQVAEETRLEGADALPAALASLEGFEAPASAWETEILPARIAKYEPGWLDAQCLSGQRTWARLVPPRAANGRATAGTPVRSTPIALLERRRVPLWMSLAGPPSATQLSPHAQAVCDCLASHGALFFDELTEATRLLRSKVEDALAELVALGLVNSDSFGGLRALLVPSAQRKPIAGAKRRGRVFSFGMESAGRWSLVRREAQPPAYPPLRAGGVIAGGAAISSPSPLVGEGRGGESGVLAPKMPTGTTPSPDPTPAETAYTRVSATQSDRNRQQPISMGGGEHGGDATRDYPERDYPAHAAEGRVGGEQAAATAVEYVARTLLRRYGVVFWRLLAREGSSLPPWRDLLRVYRRLEARGEIRGGRFIAGFSGEQYALPEAVGLLRKMRRQPVSGQWVSLSGADPLNLIGILTPGARLAALTGNRLVYYDGMPIAVLSGGKVQFLVTLDAAAQWEAQTRLLRSAAPALMADLV